MYQGFSSRETKRSSHEEAQLGVEEVTWLGMHCVDLLNSYLITLGNDPTQGKKYVNE
jgi:hypothetical protein